MAQQQVEVKQTAVKKVAIAQADMMSELKSKVKVGGSRQQPDSRKIGKDEMYHGALEDILTGELERYEAFSRINICLCSLNV